MKKATLATVKSFIKKNINNLYLKNVFYKITIYKTTTILFFGKEINYIDLRQLRRKTNLFN